MTEDKTCPTCGRDDFKSRHGMKLHHSRTHGESIAGEEATCPECGDEFRVKKTRYENNEDICCSNICAGKYRSDYETHGEDVSCAVCDADLYVAPYKYNKNDNFFCSKDCHGKWLSENKTGKDHPSWSGRVEKECANCGDTKTVIPSRSDRSNHYFCDEECMYDWRSENWVGEDAPAWSGGTAPKTYGEGWTRQRQKALERDFYRCRCCNISDDEAREEFGEGLHVHHRTPFKLFDDAATANRLRNLISLCKSCHHTLEWQFTGRRGLCADAKVEYQATIDEATKELMG